MSNGSKHQEYLQTELEPTISKSHVGGQTALLKSGTSTDVSDSTAVDADQMYLKSYIHEGDVVQNSRIVQPHMSESSSSEGKETFENRKLLDVFEEDRV